MVNKKLKLFIRLGISFLLLGYLAFKVDWVSVFTAFKKINLTFYALSTLLTVLASLFLACKYYLLIRDTSIARPISFLLKLNFISRFYALFLPSAVGPEAVRWYKVTRNRGGRAFFLASTVFERLTFLFTLLVFGFFPLFFYASHSEIGLFRVRIMPLVLLSLFFVCLFITYYTFSTVRSSINSIVFRILGRQWKDLDVDSFLGNFSLRNSKASLYVSIFGLSLLWQFLFLSRLFVLFKAASLPLGFIDLAWMGSLVLLLQVIPISFAGIGVREGAYAYLFTMFNLPAEEGVLIGILIFSQMLIMAILGGLFEVMEK